MQKKEKNEKEQANEIKRSREDIADDFKERANGKEWWRTIRRSKSSVEEQEKI